LQPVPGNLKREPTVGMEIDLLANYPKTKRNVEERGQEKSEADRAIARRFGKEFFDGDRRQGYGGFNYHPRFWQPVVPGFVRHFDLKSDSSLLDVGCAKGFMLFDFLQAMPTMRVAGVDVSEYAVENSKPEVRQFLRVADARDLPFSDKSFDVVVSITTLHNLELDECARGLREVQRVSRKGGFITVDAYRNDEERKRMNAWNLTAKTVLHVDEWKELFDKVGYKGDYYWFIP
jgi:SAM-dependent methyltransferase